jgi:hypothetical protein
MAVARASMPPAADIATELAVLTVRFLSAPHAYSCRRALGLCAAMAGNLIGAAGVDSLYNILYRLYCTGLRAREI